MQKKILTGLWCLLLSNFVSGEEDSSDGLTVDGCGTVKSDLRESKIVGGTEVDPGELPWMVSLQYRSRHMCGATVINENWILTAAHCIHGPITPSMLEAVVGLHKKSKPNEETVQRIKIAKFAKHEKFNSTTWEEDIALLKLAKPIDIEGSKGYVNGICLPEPDDDPTGDAEVAGWGKIKDGGESSDVLLDVTVPIVNRKRCKEIFSKDPLTIVTESMLCAGKKDKDGCGGDSGGPLYQKEGNVTVQIGIVSWGIGCGHRYFPGVYTRVSSYIAWMTRTASK